jgi:hypothetical protein
MRTHPDTPCLPPRSLKNRKQPQRLFAGKRETFSPTKRHFFTLPLTLEDRELSVKEYPALKARFFSIKSRT